MMTTVLAGKYPQNIASDAWLSELLGRDVFRVTLDEHFINYPGILNVFSLHPRTFFYAKAAVDDLSGIRFLEEQGFHLIDTNVTFEKAVEPKTISLRGVTIRLAQPADKEKVKTLAGSCFEYSRFHLDPLIDSTTAAKIKAEWAGNYFDGKRGQAMIVAQKAEAIVGFLQLLNDGKGTLTIDLIGVDKNSRRQGVAHAMIDFAQARHPQASKIAVGTQMANTPSVRCYEQLGFRFLKAAYVFHYHG